MILYKYLSAKSATRMLINKKLWFSAAPMLNDPFETKAGKGHRHFDKPLGEFSRNQVIEKNYKILCLTRDPLSSIMWSHYAEEHRGIVVGIDTVAAGLEDEKTCVLPAQYGSIIYTRTRPNFGYGEKNDLPLEYAQTKSYDHRLLQFLQRNFLYKSSEWHYEEEVRIVRTSHALIEDPQPPSDEYNFIHFTSGASHPIPDNAIREIYLGSRFYIYDYDQMTDIFKFLIASTPHATIYEAYPDQESWHMVANKIDNWPQHLQEIFYPR